MPAGDQLVSGACDGALPHPGRPPAVGRTYHHEPSPLGDRPSSATAVNLVVDGKMVATATGSDSEALSWAAWDTTSLQGKDARVQIVDNSTGGYGHIRADQFTFASAPALSSTQRATGWTTGVTSTPESPSTTRRRPAGMRPIFLTSMWTSSPGESFS